MLFRRVLATAMITARTLKVMALVARTVPVARAIEVHHESEVAIKAPATEARMAATLRARARTAVLNTQNTVLQVAPPKTVT